MIGFSWKLFVVQEQKNSLWCNKISLISNFLPFSFNLGKSLEMEVLEALGKSVENYQVKNLS